jgi:hypothetical protein
VAGGEWDNGAKLRDILKHILNDIVNRRTEREGNTINLRYRKNKNMTTKYTREDIKNLIEFYEKRGQDWLLAVGFLSDKIIREERNIKKCNFCGR